MRGSGLSPGPEDRWRTHDLEWRDPAEIVSDIQGVAVDPKLLRFDVRGAWWERFGWFQRKRRLHFLHHQKPHKNFAIVEYSWDLLLGTLDDGPLASANSAKPQPVERQS